MRKIFAGIVMLALLSGCTAQQKAAFDRIENEVKNDVKIAEEGEQALNAVVQVATNGKGSFSSKLSKATVTATKVGDKVQTVHISLPITSNDAPASTAAPAPAEAAPSNSN